MGGAALALPNGLPGGIKNVTWSANFWSDTAGITVNWKWAAATYNSFSSDYNALNVKPVDNKDLSVYHNGDQSGTPEAFKSFVVAGGTGGGDHNYTGNYTHAKGVKPTLGDGLQDYPYPSSNPLTSVAFNESTVLKAANLDVNNDAFELWYSDEHAMALGVRQVNVKTSSGITTTDYPITPLTASPDVALNAAVGSTATSGDQAGTDLSGRPMYPSLFITDTTNDPNARGGRAYALNSTGIVGAGVDSDKCTTPRISSEGWQFPSFTEECHGSLPTVDQQVFPQAQRPTHPTAQETPPHRHHHDRHLRRHLQLQ